jgi:2-polyprenyl-3-methyl-5-hydroxy-6-metoxy-1,4-benzoquinol methylase
MPIGSFAVLPDVVFELVKKQPKSILDLGIGFGMYGAAVREWLDLGIKPYKTNLHGVESFQKYRSPLWELYEKVHIMQIQEVEVAIKFDAIIMTDVIEHFEKQEGIDVLNKIKTWISPGGILLISTPAIFYSQGAEYGNDNERHLSLWKEDDFKNLGFTIIRHGNSDKYGHQMIVAMYHQA